MTQSSLHSIQGTKKARRLIETLDSFPYRYSEIGRFLGPPSQSTSPAATRWFPLPPPAAPTAGGWGNPGSRCVYSVGLSRVLLGGVLEVEAPAVGVLLSPSSSPVAALSGASVSSRWIARARRPPGLPCMVLPPLDPVAADPDDVFDAVGGDASGAEDEDGWRLFGVRGSLTSRSSGGSSRSKVAGRIWRRRASGTSSSSEASKQKDLGVISIFVLVLFAYLL